IAHFYNEYQFNILFVYDELFAVKKERVIEFCTRIKELKAKSGMDFDWTCDLRVTDVDKSMLAELKDAGCAFIGYGFESASQKVLNSMKKQTTVGQIEQAITLTGQAGIGVQGNFIFGDIAETPETAQETLDFFDRHCRDKMIFLSYIMPYPGSQIFQHCLDNQIISDRQDYYNRISPWGLLKFNMTAMPDDVFIKIIAHLDEVMEPAALQLKEAKVLSWAKTGQFADTAVPAGMRRPLFTIETTCPHCREPIGYLHPAAPAATTLRTFCPRCHKRFVIPLPPAMVPQTKKGWKQTLLEFFPPFLRPALVKMYAGFRRE
ncbi:MAG: hypothetical protein Q7R57_00625, partial [Dehalococcoidales bacterium]|nr:hypothetical protein [Dehalococcoidales bacterium]